MEIQKNKTGFKKGHIPWNKGKPCRAETKKKLSEANKGRKHTEEAKRKMSEKRKGVPKSKETCERMSKSNKGKPKSREHVRKSVETKKRLIKEGKLDTLKNLGKYSNGLFGDESPNWQGGLSFEPYGLDFNEKFKEGVRKRDNYCCVICNKPQEELKYKLHVHHVDYIKTNNFPQNCVSLCRQHHAETNINRTHWKTFFQSLLRERYNYEYTQDQKIILDFTR